MARIHLVDVCKTFGPRASGLVSLPFLRRAGPAHPVESHPFSIHNLNLTIPHGKTTVVLGPSGCGKTTLLKIIAGLIPIDSGSIKFNGLNMQDVPPGERRIGMLFQSYALYPHLTAKTNILSYFFFRDKTPELDAEAELKYQRTSELLGVGIDYLKDRLPPTLSGGEKQRVALGRCITRDPKLFLLDEPFANLDPVLREKYRVSLKTLLNQFSITTVYVTHDQYEAMLLADQIAIMDDGRIEQLGTYQDIYTRPKNIFVAEFLNLDPETPPINLVDGCRLPSEQPGTKIGVRPEDVVVLQEPKEDAVRGIVVDELCIPLKGIAILTMRAGENAVVASVPLATKPARGDAVGLLFNQYHVFDGKTGLRTRSVMRET
jgi:multiple sugar transport system ATP-binding protein